MQVCMLRKIVLFTLIGTSLCYDVNARSSLVVKNSQDFTTDELMLIKRAQIQFKKAKKSIKAQEAHVDRFSCKFKLDSQLTQKPCKTISRLYFSEYHMQPVCQVQLSSIDGKLRPEEIGDEEFEKVVEVVFQNHNKHKLTFVCKGKHKLTKRPVELASSFDA